MSIMSLFDIGKTALLANRRALDTVAHNVANAATPGYSRQKVVLQNIPSETIIGTGAIGRGVRIVEVQRMYDSFITSQLRNEKSNLSYWNMKEKGIAKVDHLFNESSDIGISHAIVGFFNAWQEVSQNPEGHTQRTLLISKADYLSLRISTAYTSLDGERAELFKGSQVIVEKVNNIAKQIASLNEQIATSPGALDLKDQRDILIERLNQIVRVNTFEDNAGRYSVFIGGTPTC